MVIEDVKQFELRPWQVRDLARHQPELLKPNEERGPLEGVEAEYIKDVLSIAMQHENEFAKRLFGEIEGVGAVRFSISYVDRDEPSINVIFEGVDGEGQLLGEIDRTFDGEEIISVWGTQGTDPEDLELIRPDDDLWDPVVGELVRALDMIISEKLEK